MTMQMQIEPVPAQRRAARPQDPARLGFGSVFTDHLFTMRWSTAQGWHAPRLGAFEPLALSPAAMVLHYAQTVFEGLKAYRTPGGALQLFRPGDNAERFERSARRLALPALPPGAFVEAVEALVALDHEWVPAAPGTSLYIRPTLIATEPHLGVRPAREALFFVVACPVGPYYPEGFAPVRILVSERYVRAAPGGLGAAKTGANYAASLLAAVEAQAAGYSQVLWLDALQRRFVEEVGSMNILFKIGGTVLAPPPGETTLAGITIRSVLALLRGWGVPVQERPVSIDEVLDAHAAGTLEEAFGAGTAAVIAPVGLLAYRGREHAVADGRTGPLARRLFEELTGIQYGLRPDPAAWIRPVAPITATPVPAAVAAPVAG
jgi:branched-chain amino acid aminotransferase